MKIVKPLSHDELITLQEAYANHPKKRVRIRAHAIILSNKNYPIKALADIFDAKFETVSLWLDLWEQNGVSGLFDAPRKGRPSIYTSVDIEVLKEFVDEEPHQLKRAKAKLESITKKKSSLNTIKRLLKKQDTATKERGSR